MHCRSSHTQRKGVRRGAIKYLCLTCHKWFQINRKSHSWSGKQLALFHLDGISFRTLSDQSGLSVGTAFNRVQEYLSSLPQCIDITREYCQRFSGILIVDGKFIKIKGYNRKLPVIYGVDYSTHDFPHYRLSRDEGYISLIKFFSSLKLANYPLQAVVCDDNQAIRDACLKVYPSSSIQLCQNHYKQNIRASLDLNNQPYYLNFMTGVETLFAYKRSEDDLNKRSRDLLRAWGHDSLCASILIDLYKNKDLLFGWRQAVRGMPTTTNLIECFNSHLQGRLETIKGFDSFNHADIWLNGYFIRRRGKKLTDCSGRFVKLNGSTPLFNTKKPGIELPSFFK